MDVYLIPVGSARYELYCEDLGEAAESVGDVPPTGRLVGLYHKFKAALAKVEEERLSEEPPGLARPRSWTRQMKDRALCWIAEKIAEQRLLWRLRNQNEVKLFHPDDLSDEEAIAVMRSMLQREADFHLRWSLIDGAVFAVTAPLLFLVPGPNVVAYYFGFRLVGHYLSRQGAKHALVHAQWSSCSSEQLSRLRRAAALSGHERASQVHQVATELHLVHLATFFERTAIHPA